jgi:hypothetical protein
LPRFVGGDKVLVRVEVGWNFEVSSMKSSAKEGKMIAATGDDGLREI